MGSIRRQLISDSALCKLYGDGMARDAIGMRAGLWDYEVVECLRRNGVALRNDPEARAIAIANRARYKSTERARTEAARLRRKPKAG